MSNSNRRINTVVDNLTIDGNGANLTIDIKNNIKNGNFSDGTLMKELRNQFNSGDLNDLDNLKKKNNIPTSELFSLIGTQFIESINNDNVSSTTSLDTKLSNEISSTNSDTNSLNLVISSLNTRISNVIVNRSNIETSTNTRISTAESDLASTISDLSNEISSTDSEVNSLNTRMSNEISSTDSDVNSLNSRISSEISSTDSDVNSLNSRISSEISSTDSDINSLNTRISNEVSSTNSDVISLNSAISNEISSTKSDVLSLNTSITNIESNLNTSISNEISSTNSDVISLNSAISNEISSTNSDVTSINTFITNLETDLNTAISNEISSTESDITSLDTILSPIIGSTQIGNNIIGLDNQMLSYLNKTLAISDDGNTIVIGSYRYNYNDITQNPNGGLVNGGMVQVYNYNNSTSLWDQLGQNIIGLHSGNGLHGEYIGYPVNISSNGQIISFGANGAADTAGLIRVFEYDSSSNLWIQLGSDIDIGQSTDDNLSEHSMSADGLTLGIGCNRF